MGPKSQDEPLSQISTQWSELRQAYGGPGAADARALDAFMNRYHRAVYRYLLGALRDPDAAQEVFQEFAVRFLKGGLRGADPQRGRFRDYLKGVIFRLVAEHKRRRPSSQPLPADLANTAAAPSPDSDPDHVFLASWRDELLALAWAALAERERQTGQPFYTVLRMRSDHPELQAPQLAERLASALGKPVRAVAARQMLHRARERFADLLLAELARSLESATVADLEQELIDLGLLEYCRPALLRHGRDT